MMKLSDKWLSNSEAGSTQLAALRVYEVWRNTMQFSVTFNLPILHRVLTILTGNVGHTNPLGVPNNFAPAIAALANDINNPTLKHYAQSCQWMEAHESFQKPNVEKIPVERPPADVPRRKYTYEQRKKFLEATLINMYLDLEPSPDENRYVLPRPGGCSAGGRDAPPRSISQSRRRLKMEGEKPDSDHPGLDGGDFERIPFDDDGNADSDFVEALTRFNEPTKSSPNNNADGDWRDVSADIPPLISSDVLKRVRQSKPSA